jgi:hypothetical protein
MTSPCSSAHPLRPRLALLVLAGIAACDAPAPDEPTGPVVSAAPASPTALATATVFATGLRFPRGLTWGPDGSLYVGEAGNGGTHSTTSRQCTQVTPPIGPYTNGATARISRISPNGHRTTFAHGFPSALNPGGNVLGVADVAFLHGHLYALVAGGGCSHGTRGTPAGVAKVAPDGSWHIVANLSAYLADHPVAHPPTEDFEPDGTWYSMVAGSDYLFAVEPNHGELVRILPGSGKISRIADISASQGHVVPTVLALHDGAFYLGNLGTFPITTGAERLFRIERDGARPDRPRQSHEGLFLPTALRFGPDGRLYISNKGFGPPQPGEILRVDVPGVTPASVAVAAH